MANTGRLVNEILVPAEHAKAYHVREGQRQRIIMIDGPQVGDMAIFNAKNVRETFDAGTSYIYNSVRGLGTEKTITEFYSRAPYLNVMCTVVEDTVRAHWVIMGSKCAAKRYELMGLKGYHRNCFDNIVEVIVPLGLRPDDVGDVFNMFMNVTYDEHGRYQFKPPAGRKGDYIELRSNMDCLVALSACPAGDVTTINGEGVDKGNKPLKVEIWE
jgi:uncharacterized protein YcgI (DUF1989 family)